MCANNAQCVSESEKIKIWLILPIFRLIEIYLKGTLRTITANAKSCARESFKSSTIQRSNVGFALIPGKGLFSR